MTAILFLLRQSSNDKEDKNIYDRITSSISVSSSLKYKTSKMDVSAIPMPMGEGNAIIFQYSCKIRFCERVTV